MQFPKFALSIGLALTLAACGTTPTPHSTQADAGLAPLYADGETIPGQYIVALKDGSLVSGGVSAQTTASLLGALGLSSADAQVRHVYSAAFQGFAAQLKGEALEKLRRDARVAYIEQDQVMRVVPQGEGGIGTQATQSNATWGLDRIDQRNMPLNGTYVYNRTGSGVTAYVVDTGIRTTHTQFGGRARAGYTAINDGRGSSDCNGHGTHVAGTVGGSTHGVAKSVSLVAVRVLDCNGSGATSGIIAGLDWIRTNRRGASVANMSLGGGASSSLDTATNNLWNSGVTVVVAAGNENQNACNVSPARASGVITVASSTSSDARSSFSNYGSCVELFAPGS